jgi:hypothetical protein
MRRDGMEASKASDPGSVPPPTACGMPCVSRLLSMMTKAPFAA